MQQQRRSAARRAAIGHAARSAMPPAAAPAKFRVAVGGVEHETNQLLASVGFKTEMKHFDSADGDTVNGSLLRGAAVAELGSSNTIVDGLVAGCAEQGIEVVPLCYAKARTGGPVDQQTLRHLVSEIISPLRAQLPVDGVLLSLHGAFCAEEGATSNGAAVWREDDADGAILSAVRSLVGPSVPIFSVHDLHCNISEAMVEAADLLVVERTYPHVDMAERAMHATELMAQTLRGELIPTMAWCSLPMFWSAKCMIETQVPFSELIQKVEALSPSAVGVWPSAAGNQSSLDLPATTATMSDTGGLLSASVGVGFQWADSPTMGASVIVATDDDYEAAHAHASALAHWIWDRREIYQAPSLTVSQAIEAAEAEGDAAFPVILADQGDNTGGGAPGDATHILRLFVERGFENAIVLYIVDPEAAAECAAAGVGARLRSVAVGGKSHERLGPPMMMDLEILAVSDGNFTYTGPMWHGRTESVGTTVWVRQAGVELVIISLPQQPVDLALCQSLGLDCASKRWISVKSPVHFRSGFEAIAGSIHNVDGGTILSHKWADLKMSRLGRKVYPVDADASFDTEVTRRSGGGRRVAPVARL